MQINFDSYPAEVRKQNRYLREALGSEENHARYQWAWSGDLVMPMVLMDDESHVIYDYHCACGVNVSVHSAECTFSVPRARWEIRNLAFGIEQSWVFVRWQWPECQKDVWEAHYGSLPYPEGGYFIPVSDGVKCIWVKDIPYRQTSELMVAAVREHQKKTAKQHAQAIRDRWDAGSVARRERLIEQFKEAFPVHEGFPGKKENWSQGGIGESPVLAKDEIKENHDTNA